MCVCVKKEGRWEERENEMVHVLGNRVYRSSMYDVGNSPWRPLQSPSSQSPISRVTVTRHPGVRSISSAFSPLNAYSARPCRTPGAAVAAAGSAAGGAALRAGAGGGGTIAALDDDLAGV